MKNSSKSVILCLGSIAVLILSILALHVFNGFYLSRELISEKPIIQDIQGGQDANYHIDKAIEEDAVAGRFEDDLHLHSPTQRESCFCKLQGKLDDCTCNIDTVDYFNNIKIYPLLKSLLVKDYFRYFKINLHRECPFWPTDTKCALRDCSVTTCSDDQVPPGLKGSPEANFVHPDPENLVKKYYKEMQENNNCDENHGGLGAVNVSISHEIFQDFARWQLHDDSQDNFCEMDDELSGGMQYVDLLLNPERYTGYKGPSAHRIWKSIYEENCFKPSEGYGPYTTSKNLNAMCLEKRVFYRAISGLHTSINIHACSEYYTPAVGGLGKGKWGPNVKEFQRRFDPKLTEGEGPERLKNLYFLYLLELKALAKVSPYLEQEAFYTGNTKDDEEVRIAIKKLLEIAKSFPNHFNESIMFKGNSKRANKLKEEFKQHFRNISRIMDCVGCDKCRLWGKIQTQGLGTAFKILFAGDKQMEFTNSKTKFHLKRPEIVALLNAFGKLSNSVFQVDRFRKLLNES